MSGSGLINRPLRDEPGLETKKSVIIPDHQRTHAKSQKGQWGSMIHWDRFTGINSQLCELRIDYLIEDG